MLRIQDLTKYLHAIALVKRKLSERLNARRNFFLPSIHIKCEYEIHTQILPKPSYFLLQQKTNYFKIKRLRYLNVYINTCRQILRSFKIHNSPP